MDSCRVAFMALIQLLVASQLRAIEFYQPKPLGWRLTTDAQGKGPGCTSALELASMYNSVRVRRAQFASFASADGNPNQIGNHLSLSKPASDHDGCHPSGW